MNILKTSSIASTRQVDLLAALLDHVEPPWRAGELPPLAHWLLFPPLARQSELGEDGHPRRFDDALPRRMWAGSRVRFLSPVPLEAEVHQETVEMRSEEKTGRSGRMQFLTLRHTLFVGDQAAIEEEQDIVYRQAATPGTPARLAPSASEPRPPKVRELVADPVRLFRYSALSFNSHRIHYDRPYAIGAEGYPGLVVHGPYLATLLMDLYLRHRPGSDVRAFSFRALRPVFDGEPLTLGLSEDGEGGDLVVIDADTGAAQRARVDVR